ncbi:hypothetical protein [Halostella salina]|uniref:hypothetical protein n=1 Tax=Halostella salina TaxID=1547897 RepID=UPI000EF76044|nr:hypothetical protein [Halostella salina]
MTAEVALKALVAALLDGSGPLTAIGAVGLYYVRGIRQDAHQALRILRGEPDVEQDDGLIGRVERIDKRSKANERAIEARTDGGEPRE